MKISRRNFVATITSTMVALPLLKEARAATDNHDPLGIRSDFPLLKKTNLLNKAYHAVSPTKVVDAGVKFYKDRANLVGIANIEAHTVPLAHSMKEQLVENGLDCDTLEGNPSSFWTFYHGKNPAKVHDIYQNENIKVTYKRGGKTIRFGAALSNNQADIDHFNAVTSEIAKLS